MTAEIANIDPLGCQVRIASVRSKHLFASKNCPCLSIRGFLTAVYQILDQGLDTFQFCLQELQFGLSSKFYNAHTQFIAQ